MVKYYLVKPEVAGGLGPETEMDRSVHPPRVSKLHYEVAEWLGDGIVQSFPCFLVVRSLGNKLQSQEFTGVQLASALVTEADEFRDLNPEGVVPDLVWLVVDGVPGVDDFGVTGTGDLIVSERILELLREASLVAGSFSEWEAVNS